MNRIAAESQHKFKGHAFNVGSGNSLSNNEVLDLLRIKFPNLEVSSAPARPGDVRETLADVSIAKRVLGWEPEVQFEDGLKMTLDWWEFDAGA
jgi:nucleoside-diphosphate-sugar epimerase